MDTKGGVQSQEDGAASTHHTHQLASTPTEGEVTEDCEMVVEPNKMVYFDGDGVQKAIYMPKGTFQKAAQHFQAKNFDELAKYPAWGRSPYLSD
jgi:hypothetical protein